MTLQPGQTLSHYRLVEKIGEGKRLLFVRNVNPIDAQPVIRVVQNWHGEFDNSPAR